jgi:hypothetical protein
MCLESAYLKEDLPETRAGWLIVAEFFGLIRGFLSKQ